MTLVLLPVGRVRRCVLAATLVGLASCTTILDSQADGDSPSGPGALPGAPSGDSVSAAGNVTFEQGSIQLFSSAETQTGVSFRPTQNHGNPDEYIVSLVGVPTASPPLNPVVAIDIIDTAQRRACGLEISNDEFRLVSGDGVSTIGRYDLNSPSDEQAEHRIIMRLSKASSRCFVTIRQFAPNEFGSTLLEPVIEANASFTDTGFDILSSVQIVWESVQPDSPTYRYIIGPVTVTAR
ncbi:MAG: hypothetical protein L3J22_05710 [Xanthomonadales bacterium]|nr:hypothetical protein [Xanthomonadales bacterium]